MDLIFRFLKTFIVGGALCAVGQIILCKTNITPARILTGYVVTGVVLGALGIYVPLVKWAGCGASIPLTGFGNALAQGVKNSVNENGFTGIFTGGLEAAAGGLAAAVFFGLIFAFIFKSKEKN